MVWDPQLVALRLISFWDNLKLSKIKCLLILKSYVRYTADESAVFNEVNSSSTFSNVLNSQHDNIKFTIEKSTNTLQFLDVDIKISENTVDTLVRRKPFNMGLFLNFAALCTIKWKSGSVFCMLHRAKLICSSDSLFFRDFDILKSLILPYS